MVEAHVARMPRSPFQMRPIENPLRRVLPAVERFRDRVVTEVRDAGRSLNDRLHRQHTLPADQGRRAQIDTEQLARARSTILQQNQNDTVRRSEAISKPHSAKQAIVHGVAEATKNAAPAMIVGAGARLVLGAGLGLQTLAVASGASAVSRGLREATFTIRKGAFAETTKLITKHEEGAKLTNFDGSERQSHTGIRAKQDQFAQTRVGKVVNAMLHGGEKTIAQFAYGKHRHAKALLRAQTQDIRTLSDRELIALREHAVMARMTHGTADKVYEMRQLAKSTYQSVNQELADRGISRYEAHERQLRLYKKDVRVGAVVNVVGQAGLAALKALPKTVATFFITDAFLKAIHVDTRNRHNPLEGFENTRLGQFIEHAIAPKSVAHAEAMTADISQNVSPPTITDQTSEAQRFGSSWMTHRDDLRQSVAHDPRLTTTVRVEHGETIIESRGVLSSETPKPVMPAPVEAPREPSFVRAPVADRVAIAQEVNASVPMREVARTVQEVQEYTIDGKISWTQDIFDRKLLSGMQDAAHSMDWYGAPGTGERMAREVFAVNPVLMDASDMQKMQEYLATHPDASFVQMWKDLQHTVFSDDMDKLTDGTAYKVLSEHTVMVQEPVESVADAHEADALVMGASRASKPSGLAKYVLNTDQQTAPPTPPGSVRMTNEEYLAMRQVVASGQPVNPNGVASVATPNGGTLTPEQYLAMTRNTASVTPTSPVSVGSSGNGNVSVEEYQRLIAQTQRATVNVNEAVNNGTTRPNPRMDTNEYLRIQRETAARAAEAARTSQQMDPQEYMRRVAEINARNGGGSHVSATQVTDWESSQHMNMEANVIGPVDLRNGLNHTMTISSNSPRMFSTTDASGNYLPINTTNIPMTQVINPNIYIDTPAYNSVTYFYDPVEGGLVINGHTGRNLGRIQLLEGFREYVEGYGFNGHQMYGPAQLQRLAQEYVTLNSGSTTEFTFDGRSITTRLTSFSVDYRDTTRPFGEPYRLIGSGPDTITLVGCNWSHIEAIGMISSLEEQAGLSIPAEYSGALQTIRDPYASAEQVTAAVQRVLPWLRQLANENKFDFNTFHLLIGNLPGESKTFDEMPGLADHGKIRMVFEIVK